MLLWASMKHETRGYTVRIENRDINGGADVVDDIIFISVSLLAELTYVGTIFL